ncbi:MAG: sugar ABC transporter permease [Oscillospiraceae bacterium]|nr:sugar ABC transporter permease [Oscillospiraceae bacterium]
MLKKKNAVVIFLGPAILLYILVFLYPAIRTVIMSFFDVKNITSAVSDWGFVGVQNFTKLFDTRLFIESLKNISKIWLWDGIATILLSLLTAVILTSNIKWKKFFRAIIYLPNVIAAIAVGYMWILYVFNNKFGMLTTLFAKLGMEKLAAIQWTDQQHLFFSMSIAYVFCNIGYYMLIYVAAIEKIPGDYYEAANIEGASPIRCFFSITLPLIKSVFATSLVLWTTRVMGFFELSLVFSDITTVTPMVYTYNALFGTEQSVVGMNVGVAAASAVIMTVLVMMAFLLFTKLIKEENHEM